MSSLQLWQNDSLLGLVLAFAVGVAGFANLVGLEEDDLAQALVGINSCRERRGVRDFQRNEAFPLGLERGHVHDDAAASIGTFAYANGEHTAGDLEVFDRAR